jgi:hypothetical protein
MMNFKHLSLSGGLAALGLAASLTLPASAKTNPHASSVKACMAANAYQPAVFIAAVDDGPGKIVGGGPDGLDGNWVPGFYVLIESSEGLFLCDATGNAEVWVFAEIGDPLSLGNPVG